MMTELEFFETVTLPQIMYAITPDYSYGICWETFRRLGLDDPKEALIWANDIAAKIGKETRVKYRSDGIYFIK